MSTELPELPEPVLTHLQDVSSRFGLPDDDDTMQKLVRSWKEKRDTFESKTIDLGMDEVGEFDPEDERSALFLTYSGSLISVGALVEGSRNVEYTSIGFRRDVPDSLSITKTNIAESAVPDRSVSFTNSPLKNTSPLFKIVVCPESLTIEEQDHLLREAATIITDTFVGLNKDLLD